MKDGSLLIDHRKKKTYTKRRNNIYKKTYTERKHHRKNKYIRSVNWATSKRLTNSKVKRKHKKNMHTLV